MLSTVSPTFQWSIEGIFLACLVGAALGGFAVLLRTKTELVDARNVAAYTLWFGLTGLATAMLGFNSLGGMEFPWQVIGTSIVSGMGAVPVIKLGSIVLEVVRTTLIRQGKDDDPKS